MSQGEKRDPKPVDFPPQVSEIQSRSAQMEVRNNHLDSDLKQCERSRKEAANEAANQLQNKQRSHDDQVEYNPAVTHRGQEIQNYKTAISF